MSKKLNETDLMASGKKNCHTKHQAHPHWFNQNLRHPPDAGGNFCCRDTESHLKELSLPTHIPDSMKSLFRTGEVWWACFQKPLPLSPAAHSVSAAPTKFTWQGTQPFANKQLLASNDLRSQKIAPQPRCTARHSCTRICFPSNVVISAPVAKKIQNGSFPHND